jgi:ubiquinone/menaquinone biosynthesis C-methylase UbiE
LRTTERKREQFELERRIRRRILDSDRSTRAAVVSGAYAELFTNFPDHDVFTDVPERREQLGRRCAAMIRPFAERGARILEVGCGRGDVITELARSGFTCIGIDPSAHMLDLSGREGGPQVRSGPADELEFPDRSFDIVFSQQVLEHLHPEDVPRHFGEAFRVLRPGGQLIVETPNRRTGPQDISRGFVPVAEGLHLKEWSFSELIDEFARAGFVRVRGLLAPPFLARRSTWLHRVSRIPAIVKHAEDLCLACVPGLKLRTLVGKAFGLDDIFLVGQKPNTSAER